MGALRNAARNAMAYRFKTNEPLASGIHRILEEQGAIIASGLQLAAPVELDKAIHEARRSFKRLRAILRLLEHALDPPAFHALDRALRDLSRRLAGPRDAWVLIQTWRRLDIQPGSADAPGAEASLLEIDKLLQARYLEAQTRLLTQGGSHREVASRVADVLSQADTQIGDHLSSKLILRGLRAQYRRARRALRDARKNPLPAVRHEARKEIKYLWHLIQLLEPASPKPLKRSAAEFKRLSNLLGDEHDLVVLLHALESASVLSEPALELVRSRVRKRFRKLAGRADVLGASLLAQRPSDFSAALGEVWKSFHPDKLDD